MADFKGMASARDSVYKVRAKNGTLAKSLNTLRTVPGAPNPFILNPRRGQTTENSAGSVVRARTGKIGSSE